MPASCAGRAPNSPTSCSPRNTGSRRRRAAGDGPGPGAVRRRARQRAAALRVHGVTTGGTDTHLITADPGPLGVDGRTGRRLPTAAGMVPACAPLPRGEARGLRLGTAAPTTRGMGEPEMRTVGALLAGVLRGTWEAAVAREAVREPAEDFPPYPG